MEFIIEILGIFADFLLFADYKGSKLKRFIEIVILTVCFIATITLFINLAIAASGAYYLAGIALYIMVIAFIAGYLIIFYNIVFSK